MSEWVKVHAGGACLGYPKHVWRKSPRARVAEKQRQEAEVQVGRGPAYRGPQATVRTSDFIHNVTGATGHFRAGLI